MATVRSKYEVGNQASMIRRAFSNQTLEGLALARGAHPARAMGIGQAIPPSLLPNPTASWDLSNPTFSTTVTSSPPSDGGWLSSIINTAGDFITSRWGQQRGTITYNPDGSIVQKQAAGMPIQTSAPYIVGGTIPGQFSNQSAAGFAMGTGSMMLIGVGVLAIVLMSRK